MLGVLYPFHGVEAKKIQGEIKNELKKIRIRPHKIDVFSTVTAQIADGRTFGSDYWMEQVYKPVQFYKTMNEVIDRGCNFIVEINTQAILMPFLSQDFPKSEVVSALQKNVSPLYSGGYSIFSMFATTLQAKSWQIYKSFSSYGLFQEPISMIFPSGSAIKQVRCPHGSVVGSNKDVAPCATAF